MSENTSAAEQFTDRIISTYGNKTGHMVIRTFADGTKKTVHTGSRIPKAKTAGLKKTNVGSAVDNLRRMK